MPLSTAEARARRRVLGHCLWCKDQAEPGRSLCAKHREINREQRRQARRKEVA